MTPNDKVSPGSPHEYRPIKPSDWLQWFTDWLLDYRGVVARELYLKRGTAPDSVTQVEQAFFEDLQTVCAAVLQRKGSDPIYWGNLDFGDPATLRLWEMFLDMDNRRLDWLACDYPLHCLWLMAS